MDQASVKGLTGASLGDAGELADASDEFGRTDGALNEKIHGSEAPGFDHRSVVGV